MNPKITEKKENIIIGIAVPKFCIQAFIITRYHSRGQSSNVLKRGVVAGRVALLIRLEANTFMHIHQADFFFFQSQVCCLSAPVTLEGESLCSSPVQSVIQGTIAIQSVICLICSSNSVRREISSP